MSEQHEHKYQPLTPDQRESAVYDSREKPYFEVLKSIVLAAEFLAIMVQCGEHSKEELEEAADDVLMAIHNSIPAMAISILATDDTMTSPEHMEDHFGGKIQ